jgi:tetratricopeptide (TPR) repeat protein
MQRERNPYYKPAKKPAEVKKGKAGAGLLVRWLLALALVGIGGYLGATPGVLSATGLARYLPVPKKLLAIQVLHNDQKINVDASSQLILNPRDTLQILDVKTDGWMRRGTRLAAAGFPVETIRQRAEVIGKLWPAETFEVPKQVELQAFWGDVALGQVTLVVQLDARDWMQKALSVGDVDQKISYLNKVLQENPGNVLAKTQLAGIYLENRKYAQAAQLYEEIAEKGKSREILESLLKAYQQQGKVDQAVAVYLELLKLTQDVDHFKQFLAYLQKQHDKQFVADFLARNQRNLPKEYQANVVLVIAELYSQTRDWSKAAAAYEEAIRRGIKDANVYYNLAIAYQHTKDYARSAKALGAYLQKNPKDTKSQLELAQLQVKQGAPDQARATYEAILKEDPNQEKVLLRLIALLEKANDKAGLKVYYQRLAKLQPKNKLVQFNLGVLDYEAKNWPEAISAFEAVASLDSKDVESRKHLLDLYRKQGNQKGEVSILENLIQLQPDQSTYYDNLFGIYDKKQDFRGMVDLFREVAKKRPDSVQAHQYLLYGLLKQGNKKAAVGELEQLIRLQPNDKKHLRQAANLYEEVGNYSEALKKIGQLLKLDPKNKEAQDDYMRLRLRLLGSKKASQG